MSPPTLIPGQWDLEHDHVELLNLLIQRLSPGGKAYFCTTSRRFKLRCSRNSRPGRCARSRGKPSRPTFATSASIGVGRSCDSEARCGSQRRQCHAILTRRASKGLRTANGSRPSRVPGTKAVRPCPSEPRPGARCACPRHPALRRCHTTLTQRANKGLLVVSVQRPSLARRASGRPARKATPNAVSVHGD